MPRRAASPEVRPFEVKVGIGFASFGGMYRLGDPSMCPPSRFRMLVNVRLGEKDVSCRPGLTTAWSGQGDPVFGMMEILKRDAGKILFGPRGDSVGAVGLTPTTSPAGRPGDDPDETTKTFHLYHGIVLDNDFTALTAYAQSGKVVVGYIRRRRAYGVATVSESQKQTTYFELAPVGHHIGYANFPQVAPAGKTPVQEFIARGYAVDVYSNDQDFFTHDWTEETAISSGGDDFVVFFPDELQWGQCLDALVRYEGRWLAAGSIIGSVENPGVLAGKASGAAGTGTQVFEVVFATELPAEPPANLQGLVDSDQTPFAPWSADQLKSYFGGSLAEVLRLPGVNYDAIPSRAAGGLDGKSIRSMVVRQIRQDNPVTAAQITKDKLYMGTFGGFPVTPAAWKTVDVELIHAFANLTNGEVYSWDGSTVKLERTGLGPYVVVGTLPDGSVVAAGRTAGAFLDAKTETWSAVTYNPTYSTLPRASDAFGTHEPINPNADWKSHGFIWTDRKMFRGELYFIGYDTARVASNAQTSAGFPFPLLPPGEPATTYIPTADQWVLYKFDRTALQLVRVRTGFDIWTDLKATRWPAATDAYRDAGRPGGYLGAAPCLELFNDELYYSWCFDVELVRRFGIGKYNGSSFDDDAVWFSTYTVGPPGVADPLFDMLTLSDGLYLAMGVSFGLTATAGALRKWDGTGLVTLLDDWGKGSSSAPFAINVGAHGRMFVGPR